MLKKRLIFTLLYDSGNFVISRNFRLQKVGDINWLKCNYNFIQVSKFIDELIILDVTRGEKDRERFIDTLKKIRSFVFIPVSVGGGINTVDAGLSMLANGADKIIVNSIMMSNSDVAKNLVKCIGSQSVVGSIDYMYFENDYFPYVNNGTEKCPMNLSRYIRYTQNLGVGEIYLNCISRDGTGDGYDIDLLCKIVKYIEIPLICAGGAGKKEHFYELLSRECFFSVATAHLFNFIGDGLKLSREFLLKNNIYLAEW